MRHRLTGLVVGLAALLLSVPHAQAGEINASEQSLISAISQSFSYNGGTYVVKDSYIAEGKAKLAADGVNLSAAEAKGYISRFHGSYQELVEEGYCDRLDDGSSREKSDAATAEQQHSKQETETNRVFLQSILGDASEASSDKMQTSQNTKKSGSEEAAKNKQAAASPTPEAGDASAGEAWSREEDLGGSLDFRETDRKQAKEQRVTISGAGASYSVQTSGSDSGEAEAAGAEEGEAQANFVSGLLHLQQWKLAYLVLLGYTLLSLAGAAFYLFKVKRHKRKRRRMRKWLAVAMGVGFGGWTFFLLGVLGLYFGIYNNGAIQRQLMESDYFLGVTRMTRELAQEQLAGQGYRGELAAEVFTLSSVYIEEKQYIENVLQGNKAAEVSTEGIRTQLEQELVGEDGTVDEELVAELEETYRGMLQFELGSVIRESREEFMIWFYAGCITGILFLLLLFVLLYAMYDYLHKAVRVSSIALLASSVLVTAGAFAAKIAHVADKITASPVYYQQFLQKYVLWAVNVLFYVGCIGILASIGLFIWKRYLHMLYAE